MTTADRDKSRAMTRLRKMRAHLEERAMLIRNGGFNMDAEKQAGELADDASAIKWAMRQIEPETEMVGQLLGSLHGAGE